MNFVHSTQTSQYSSINSVSLLYNVNDYVKVIYRLHLSVRCHSEVLELLILLGEVESSRRGWRGREEEDRGTVQERRPESVCDPRLRRWLDFRTGTWTARHRQRQKVTLASVSRNFVSSKWECRLKCPVSHFTGACKKSGKERLKRWVLRRLPGGDGADVVCSGSSFLTRAAATGNPERGHLVSRPRVVWVWPNQG